jgi:hypothetical protein
MYNLHFSLKQDFSFLLTKNIVAAFSVIPGYRISSLQVDTIITDIYGLRKKDGSANIRKLTCDVGIDFSFKIVPKIYFNLDFVNGLTYIIKVDANKHPVLREFYPHLRITKFI